jgi:phosphoglycolate phosphatase
MILEAKAAGGRFRSIAGPDAETPAKPDPTMLRRLMEDAGAVPGGTIVVGDMEVDFDFARAAGCRVVLIPGGSRTRAELAALSPDAFLDSIVELPAWLEGRASGVPPVESRPS